MLGVTLLSMGFKPSIFRQRFLAHAACWSLYTPLVVLLLLLILLTLNDGREALRIWGVASIGSCIMGILAGLAGMLRIVYCRFDRLFVIALAGVALSLCVGFIAYITYLFSFVPSC